MAEGTGVANHGDKRAWDYFELHASQRLTTFNFYVVISSLIAAGLLGTFEKDYRAPYLGVGLGVLLGILSFVFWKLDERNKLLIKNAEAALKFFEGKAEPQVSTPEPHITKVFMREDFESKRVRDMNSWWRPWSNHYSYSNCFNLVFFIFGVGGAGGAILVFVTTQ